MDAKGKKGPRITGRAARIFLAATGGLILVSSFAIAKILDPLSTVPIDSGMLELSSNLYETAQMLQIDGYDDDCMEPFITFDGNYLLFNNSNSAFTDTHIHICKRLKANHFKHLGLLSGSSSQGKDMAPSIDADGHLFFTSSRSYEKDGHSIYCGDFAEETLKNVALPNGDISPHKPFEINMDCDISRDGKTLILSRAHFANFLLPPDRSDLAVAEKENGTFSLNPQRQHVFLKLNTPALEYAPCLSADQLELFFTRASKKVKTNTKTFEPDFRIMVARRKDCFSSFDEPARLAALNGFIEAPTITADKKEMFFHKKVGDKFRIFCAKRSAKVQ